MLQPLDRWLRLLALCALVTLMFAIPSSVGPYRQALLAADPPASPAPSQPAAAAEPADEPDETLFGMIMASGATGVAFMVALGLFSLVAATIALERAMNLTRTRVLPPETIRELQELTRSRSHQLKQYEALCQRSVSPLTTILKAGVIRAGRPLPEVEKSMEDATAKEMSRLRSSVRPLAVIANVAPLVGLLGTVVGMIEAFRIASQAGTGKAELLAQGIYLALLTTAAGLIIAIPAMLLAAFFNNRIDKLIWEADTYLLDTMPNFAYMEQASPAPAAAGSAAAS